MPGKVSGSANSHLDSSLVLENYMIPRKVFQWDATAGRSLTAEVGMTVGIPNIYFSGTSKTAASEWI